ncbi:unnamed protein product [Leptosia nina]|uniref:C-type lectin domain-containing protein n=1 Tax=Leptosia nina TaxID=320188 RepID=A0AAV1J785_9NEOP
MFTTKCSVLLILLANHILSSGQQEDKFFRVDYPKYIPETDSFYKVHTVHQTWEKAKETCEAEGAVLYYPDDEEEALAVWNYINATQTFYWIYIGVSSPYAPHVFITVEGHPISSVYDNWGVGEPNDQSGVERCVVIRRDGTLNDDKCDVKNPFLCKKRASTINWNILCDMPDQKYEYYDGLGRCYKFHTTPKTWLEAVQVCNAEQSYLAIIDSQLEADHFVNLTRIAKKDDVEGSYLRGAVHLGFTRTNSQWRSIKGRPVKALGYCKWGHNQPDGGDNETCGSMFYNGKLNDINCEQKCFFICEREIPILGSAIEMRYGETNKG